jgi:response regulator RpfG family c-di-GMP phosphodiesterase
MGQDDFDLLIVDDDPEILRLLTETFADDSLRMRTVAALSEARDFLSHHHIKVVLSDHNLPDGNGVDFLAELRGVDSRAIPILMTGLADLRVAAEAINRGKVYEFVTKPLDLAALTQTVQRALEAHASARDQRRMTREVIEHNERLLAEADIRENRLRLAAETLVAKEEIVARQKAHIESLYTEIQKAYLHAVTSLTAAIEAKDQYTHGHSERVYYYCSIMSGVLGLSDSSQDDLRFASVLHDLGKIVIPDSILLKNGPLTPDERSVMASHPVLTEGILKPLPFLDNVRKIIREHHERADGKGYPDGLKANEISLEGRILAVADAYDAMRSDRSYRRALTREQALQELHAGTGTQFCPLCVGALLYGLETRGEFVEHGGSNWRGQPWEEDFTGLRPASHSVRVDALLN